MILCRYCGSKIWDYAQICPRCGEVLNKEEKYLVEATTMSSNSETDFKFYLDGWVGPIYLHQDMRKKFYLTVKNFSSIPISGTEVQLSGPPHVELIIKSRKIRAKKKINKIDFLISPKELGLFTLTATLTSDVGHRIAFPIKIRVEPRDFSYYHDETLQKSALKPISPLGYYRLVMLLISTIYVIIMIGFLRLR